MCVFTLPHLHVGVVSAPAEGGSSINTGGSVALYQVIFHEIFAHFHYLNCLLLLLATDTEWEDFHSMSVYNSLM